MAAADDTIRTDRRCEGCGYNLRGLAVTGRCPECGMWISSAAPGGDRAAGGWWGRLNAFDKTCAVLAVILAVPLLILGGLGLFLGSQANFSLPPVLGVLPALIGWGIVKSVLVAWRAGRRPTARVTRRTPSIYRDPIPRTPADVDAEVDRIGKPPPEALTDSGEP